MTGTSSDPVAAPARSRGVIALDTQACTSCMLCARECPDWCIHISAHAEELPPPGAGPTSRTRTVHRLDRFAIDFGLCLFCGICVEVCPFDALFWSPATARAGGVHDLLAESPRLEQWRAQIEPLEELESGALPPRSKDSGRGHGGGRRTR
ncbi:4Fe-4S binding protein [Austwickia chelonae]|uniref:4Fe-4S binding protein n=1 Tax=Austwickia chelonae TaxID=100225 RepID=UPI000E241A2E|nr:4Fe-4S binding protein [Austwickia chelonae]